MIEAFQTVMMRLALCGLAASLALLALRSRVTHDTFARLLFIWRSLTAFGRVAVCSFLLIGVLVGGDKTNNVPPNMNQPLPQMQHGGASFQTGFTGLTGLSGSLPCTPTSLNPVNPVNPVQNNIPVQTTIEDVARGWRVESIATNTAVSYAMPSSATLVGNWHKRGTFGEWMRLELGDFAFPIGTNATAYSSFSVFNDGKIRPFPRDVAHEICAVGVPMLAMQDESRFWVADGEEDSKLLTWDNLFLDSDTNMPINAQIALYPSGDFVTRSNEVETVYRRINPDDWDDDGIHNERDANPTIYDGDFFGVANGLPPNANPNAYYWLDLSVAGVLGVATIRVTCDGASDLGDHVIIARTNQVCHIPLLAGATYTVDSNLPFDYSAVSTEYAEIVTNSENHLTVSLPLDLTFERVQMRGGSDSYIAHTSPIDVGPRVLNIAGGCCSCVTNEIGFLWDCFPQCLCGGSGHSLSGAAKWEGYSYLFSWWGRCHCYYENQAAIDEIESRGISLEILDASGNALEWKYPVLVGESVIVKATVGGSEMTASGFTGLFGGRIRLKAYYVDFDGSHGIADAAIPISAETTTSQGQNVFHVSVAAGWLQSNGIVRNADDEIVAKTSVDMSNGPDAGSDRIDSDCFDENAAGRLYGRARGRWGGNADAPIPEGEFNLKTVQAAGTACLVATSGVSCSTKKQCQQQADVFYYSGHGEHDTGRLYGVAVPADVTNHWRDVETVVFAGCAVLDIGDKGNHYSNPASHSASPGLKWAASSGASALLGYCWKAPFDNQGAVRIINNWCSNRTALGDVESWMQANANRNGRNACAIQNIDDSHCRYWYFKREKGYIYNSYSLTNSIEAITR